MLQNSAGETSLKGVFIMSILKYICGYRYDKYKNRVYSILLVQFDTIKDVVNLTPSCRFECYSDRYYPELAKDIDLKNAYVREVDYTVNFLDRREFMNLPFDTLKGCASYLKDLIKQEKEWIKKEAFTRMVNYSQIPFEYWGTCYDLAKNNTNIDFFMFRNEPCYRISNGEEVYSVKDNSILYYGDDIGYSSF